MENYKSAAISMVYDVETGELGAVKKVTRKINGVNPEISEDDAEKIADEIAKLQSNILKEKTLVKEQYIGEHE